MTKDNPKLKYQYFISPDKLTLFIDGKPRIFTNTHPDFDLLRIAVYDCDTERLEHILENPTPTGSFEHDGGTVEIEDDKITYKGTELKHSLVYRLKQMQKAGLRDPKPWLNFLTKLMTNPSQRIRDNLHFFIEDQHMALTEDGDILAYKGVRDDFMDIYSGTISNVPGNVIQIARQDVDDNPEHTCSNGLHVGDYEYAKSWGSSGKLLLVSFNPADAVSVPIDGQKLRVWRYQVLQEIAHDQPLESPLYQVDPKNQIHPMSHKHPSYVKARATIKEYLAQDDDTDPYTIEDLMDEFYGLSRKDVGRICTELGASLNWSDLANDFVIS